MKAIFKGTAVMALLTGFASVLLVSCGSSNSPSSPAATATPTPSAPTATPTLSAPSASVTFSLSANGIPEGIRYGSGALWIFDQGNRALQAWTTTGTGPNPDITSYNSGTAFSAALGDGIDPATGNVYLADTNNHTFVALSPAGAYLGKFGSVQLGTDQAGYVAVNAAGTTVYGLDPLVPDLLEYSIGGTPSSPTYTYQSTSTFGAGTFSSPQNMSFDSNGNLWVADYGNGRVVKCNSSLSAVQMAVTLTTVSTAPKPNDVVVDNSGDIFVADYSNNVVQEFNAAGQHLYNFGSGGVGSTFSQCSSLAFDPTGTYLYVTDLGVNKVYGFKVR
jgi:sugar lactone lactonase YvrE